MKMNKWIVAISIGCHCFSLNAQDVHFSQFYESAILRNPALTGIFTTDYKAGVQYKRQWGNISKPYRTTQANFEGKALISNHRNDFISFGLSAYQDKAGTINFQTLGLYPAINYNKSLEDNKSSYLSVGFTAGYVQRSIDVSLMTFDEQYGAGGFDPNNPTYENISKPRFYHWDMGAGVSFSSSLDEAFRFTYFLGISAYHFTNPPRSFMNANVVNLKTRWNGNFGMNFGLNDAFTIQTHLNVMKQGTQQELMGGALLRWSQFDNSNKQTLALYGGVFYRMKDAIVPILKLDYRNITLAASYDLTLSTLKYANNMQGGAEFTLITSGFFNPSVEDKRICPRF